MADRLLAGQLVERLAALQAAGLSHEAIAKELYAEAGVVISARTVSSWLATIEPEAAAS